MGSLDKLKSLGIRVKTEDEIKEEMGDTSEDTNAIKPPIFNVKGGTKEMAVHLGLIPAAYKEVEFDVQHIKENIVAQAVAMKRKFKVANFKRYVETLNGIISSIRTGNVPNCSYLIGAPNGFGKTSFVTTCLKLMLQREWRAAPYISLSELAEIRADNERRLIKGTELVSKKAYNEPEAESTFVYKDPTECIKMPQVITGRFSWSEYMNSQILFCFFSSIDSKVIESNTLKAILEIRSAKGLPTIAFISTSLNPYKLDYNLKEYVWDEILAYKEDKNCFDRVYHVSCYKNVNNIIGDDDLGIEQV